VVLVAGAGKSGTAEQQTVVHHFRAFSSGRIAPGIRIARTVRGFCTDSSWEDLGVHNAWRCGWKRGAASYIGDPCFTASARRRYALCADAEAPWRRWVVRLVLSKPLPRRSRPTGFARIWPWGVRTITGKRCFSTASTAGEVFRGRRISYYCHGGGLIVGYVARASRTWTVSFASSRSAHALRRVRITDAYR
jgi:hypothetical protein